MGKIPPPLPVKAAVKLPPPLPPAKPVKAPPPLPTIAPRVWVAPVNPHVRRVTLNLIRHAHVCPRDLRVVLDRLAEEYAWDATKLSRPENETIYGLVDDKLANAVKAEFAANLDTIVDHRHSDAVCKLCGHQHIRFEFLLENSEKGELGRGRDVWTGSTCIEEYGLNVQGAATAEEALRRLRAAISRAKEKVEREDWRNTHPNHAADIELITSAMVRMWGPTTRRRLPEYAMWRHLPPRFASEAKRAVQYTKAIAKFYAKKGYLTDTRTAQLYGSDGAAGLLALVETHRAAWDAALALATPPFRKHWQAFLAKHSAILTPEERNVVTDLIRYAKDPDLLWDGERRVVAAIEARANPGASKPAAESQPPKYDNSDLPF